MLPRRIRQILHTELRADTVRGTLVRSALGAAGVRVAGTAIAFLASLLYARILGPHDYGRYAYVLAWVALLSVPAGLGLPEFLVREGAKRPQAVTWLRRWADSRVLIGGVAAGILLAAAAWAPQLATGGRLFLIAAPLPLFNVLGSVRSALLRARGRVVPSQWPLYIAGPGLVLAVLAALWQWTGHLDAADVVAAMLGMALLVAGVNGYQLHRAVERPAGPPARAPVRLRSALPFMWLGVLFLINNRTDVIMLGSLRGASEAGIYSVAARAAELVTFFLTAANLVVAPRIASYYHSGEHALLQRLVTGSARRVLLISAPVTLVFVAAAYPLLYYLYGAQYAVGAVALQILGVAQLVNVSAGSVGTILNMTGHERYSALGVAISMVVNVALNGALIPHFGVLGAACATGTSLVVWNLLLWYWVRRLTGVRPTALGL